LGDQSNLESQEAYAHTFKHFQKLFKSLPAVVLTDKHPNYFVSNAGKEIANTLNVPTYAIQHHKAHFASVLAEHDLLNQTQKILGVIWDGTGYGEDGQIWGSELLSFYEGTINRIAHLNYFPILLGDKMSKEPRLSALSILSKIGKQEIVKKQFTDVEWNYYQQVLQEDSLLHTCSMGRFIDAIACIIGISSKSSFEGEAPMNLEALARNSYPHKAYYSFSLTNNIIEWHEFVNELLIDLKDNKEKDFIARKVINGLAELVYLLSDYQMCNQLAFSGGVFQNALLVDTIIGLNHGNRKLFFHKQLSPNDENISLGQMAYYINEKKSFKDFSLMNSLTNTEKQLVTN
jgi:hydrogenase maturation protein HypF